MAFRGLMEIFLKVCEKFNEVDVEYVIGGGCCNFTRFAKNNK